VVSFHTIAPNGFKSSCSHHRELSKDIKTMRGMKGVWFGRSQFEKQGHYVALPFTLKTVSLKAKDEEEL